MWELAAFDSERLARIGPAIEEDIHRERYDGAALRVCHRGDEVLREVRGFADRARGRELSDDDVFYTMSVGKQFTNTVVLQRVERGELALHTPIWEVLPEFRNRGKDRMTLFGLLTHTSGMQQAIPDLPEEDLINLSKMAAYAATSRPEHLPGERVNYSILLAHAVLAEMVLRVDGGHRSFAQILREDLFEPIGMNDTSLGPRADLMERLAPIAARYKRPGLFLAEEVEGVGRLLQREGAEIPGGGFFTTCSDLSRFAEMLRGKGELEGARVLAPATLDFVSRNYTGSMPNALLDYTVASREWERWPAGIGIGFFVRGEGVIPGPFGNLNSPRTYGGWGAGSTAFWIDPERDLTFSLLTTGIMEDSDHIERVSRLSDMVLASMVA